MPNRLILAAILLLGSAAPALSAETCSTPRPFRAMTYNIRLDTPADGQNAWAHRRGMFISQVRLLGPALLGLQEVVPGQRADMAAALPEYSALGEGRDEGGAGEASPLFVDRAQFRVRSSGMFWLSPTPVVPSKGWDAAYRRVATWAHLRRRSDGKAVLAINTHWDNVGKQARLNSALQLRGWIAAHRGAGEAVILLGDFNAPLSEESLVALLAPPRGLTPLNDARANSTEPAEGAQITFNGWDPIPKSGDTIDHILVGPGLKVLRYHALGETFDGRLASDHFPVIADLFFSAAKDCVTGRHI
ncbi:MAG: endonuclease/exonuclease/phosphatase family protein [Novosphingobium sp.]|uniref:endonuclease/exonuclease/phosphatase family protein n=1 Tax=Novosphingobium sp. TaxID=1874826 RepID=UPI0032B9BAC7